ncbi:uncharacterized protein LOC110985024 [Acanthaster planci]|uniref:Uncharacterized protein LOC110985024 n=1 Tax=Acanthaster planci TaxID=133434 RepID=A0A8B7Z8X4_ACAPL|nr:uncharacterized protein LOC110985024 [Acanthaster planci]
MERKFLAVLFVLSGSFEALALKCHVCPLYGLCKDGEAGEVQTCDNVGGAVETQCLKFDGEYSARYEGATMSFSGVIRICSYTLKDSDTPPLSCLSSSESDAYMKHSLQVASELVPSISHLTVDVTSGHACFCNTDGCNGVDSAKPFLSLILVGLLHLLVM